jgi:hypothetical protein
MVAYVQGTETNKQICSRSKERTSWRTWDQLLTDRPWKTWKKKLLQNLYVYPFLLGLNANYLRNLQTTKFTLLGRPQTFQLRIIWDEDETFFATQKLTIWSRKTRRRTKKQKKLQKQTFPTFWKVVVVVHLKASKLSQSCGIYLFGTFLKARLRDFVTFTEKTKTDWEAEWQRVQMLDPRIQGVYIIRWDFNEFFMFHVFF